MDEYNTPTYQHYEAMKLVREAARQLANPEDGEIVIYRDAFRWKNDADDSVRSNHYEMFEVHSLALDMGFEVVHDFRHVAVIRPFEKNPTGLIDDWSGS